MTNQEYPSKNVCGLCGLGLIFKSDSSGEREICPDHGIIETCEVCGELTATIQDNDIWICKTCYESPRHQNLISEQTVPI